MELQDILVAVFVGGLLIAIVYFSWIAFLEPSSNIETQSINSPVVYMDYQKIKRTISSEKNYNYYLSCNNSDYQGRRIEKALGIIQNESEGKIIYHKVNSTENSDLNIYCSSETRYNWINNIAGEATVNPNGVNEIFFYNIRPTTYSGGCMAFPDIEIHEILHTLGFEHSNDDEKYSIMDETWMYCHKKIDDNIVEDLRNGRVRN